MIRMTLKIRRSFKIKASISINGIPAKSKGTATASRFPVQIAHKITTDLENTELN